MSQQGSFPGGPVLPPQMPQPRTPLDAQPNSQLLNELQSEVSTEAAPLLQFLIKHALTIMIGLGLFVVVLVGVGTYNWYTNKTEAAAQLELSRIMIALQGKERIEALESFLPSAPASLQTATTLDIAESLMEMQDYDAAAQRFGDIATKLEQENPQSAMGILAALNQGQALILAQKPAEALGVLEKLLPRVPHEQLLVVQQALAEAAVQAGEETKARNTFEAMAATRMGPKAAFYLYRAKHLSTPPQTTDKEQSDNAENAQ